MDSTASSIYVLSSQDDANSSATVSQATANSDSSTLALNCSIRSSVCNRSTAQSNFGRNILTQMNTSSSSVSNFPMNNTSRSVHEISTTSNLALFSSDVIMSIVEGRGKAKGEIGLAYIDLNSPVLYLAQFLDNCSFDSLKMKCHVCLPVEIIFPHTLTENNMMMSSLVENFPNISFKSYDRRFFNEKNGFEFVQTLCYKDYTWIDIELESKYYCLAACSALIQYINSTKQVILTIVRNFIIFIASVPFY